MKRAVIALSALALMFLMLPQNIARATPRPTTISITEPTHEELDGKFLDDLLAQEFDVSGKLGQLIYNPPRGVRVWVIDPEIVEEATAMSGGYKVVSGVVGGAVSGVASEVPSQGSAVAQAWLTQLKAVTANDTVYAMAYANPSEYWINRISPHIKSYVLTIAQTKLSALLDRPVLEATTYQSNNNFYLSRATVKALQEDSKDFELTAAYIDPASIDTYRLNIVKALNPQLTSATRHKLINQLSITAAEQMQMIHLSSGKFTVTSAHLKLPITISNDFPSPVKINLNITTSNERVNAPDLMKEDIPAKSKIQILLPIHVYSSGVSNLIIRITTSTGQKFGNPIVYPLKLSVISPVATWITTGAAILLFFAAALQSFRRIRRRGK